MSRHTNPHLSPTTDELQREEDVLEWLIENKSTGDDEDIIEDVTAKTLHTLIGNIDNLVVVFCKYLRNFNRESPLYNRSDTPQMIAMKMIPLLYSRNWKISMMIVTNMESNLSKLMMLVPIKNLESSM